jgi:hypothetical protein
MWSFTNSLGIFELIERDGKWFEPSSFVEVTQYFTTKEEATVHYFHTIVKKYAAEKRELEKRIKKLDDMYTEAYQLFKIEDLKVSHPEHFLKGY